MNKWTRLRDMRLRPRTGGSTLHEIPDILVRKIISTNLFMKTLVITFYWETEFRSSLLEVFCEKRLLACKFTQN